MDFMMNRVCWWFEPGWLGHACWMAAAVGGTVHHSAVHARVANASNAHATLNPCNATTFDALLMCRSGCCASCWSGARRWGPASRQSTAAQVRICSPKVHNLVWFKFQTNQKRKEAGSSIAAEHSCAGTRLCPLDREAVGGFALSYLLSGCALSPRLPTTASHLQLQPPIPISRRAAQLRCGGNRGVARPAAGAARDRRAGGRTCMVV